MALRLPPLSAADVQAAVSAVQADPDETETVAGNAVASPFPGTVLSVPRAGQTVRGGFPCAVIADLSSLRVRAETPELYADELRADGTFASLVVGAPLLTESQASVDRAARALLAELPSGRAPGEPVLFMGHGSRHAAESRYEALAAAVRERDPLVLMGTLNGTIRLEHIVEHLRASGRPFDRVWLLPLLAVVGRHTLEDMAGDSEHSWRSRLEAEGIACVPVLRGMMEYQGFMDIWVDNLAQAMKGWG